MKAMALIVILIDLCLLSVYITRMIPKDLKALFKDLRALKKQTDIKLLYPGSSPKGFESKRSNQEEIIGIFINRSGLA